VKWSVTPSATLAHSSQIALVLNLFSLAEKLHFKNYELSAIGIFGVRFVGVRRSGE